ncbi:MAG: M20/M25/M40 family metallo-hydrolase [Flavobacteriales bacterium]|nr:M20/M25/M40 family metallo-hydrolase [Flavobacteriales bacterium]
MKSIYLPIIFLLSLSYLTAKGQNPIVQNILNDVNIDSLTFFVKQLSGEEQVVIAGVPDTIHTRQSDQPGNEKAFQFLKAKLGGYGLTVDSFQFNATGKNLLGIHEGSVYPNQKYILGAHYDNVGTGIAPGADDNASGSAAVVEAARIFADHSFPFTIVFALWDQEEQGLIGSRAYAEWTATNNDTILGYINMDMLGWDGNNDSIADLHVRSVANSMELAERAIAINSTYSIGLGLNVVNPGSGNTDHAPFWENGFSAIGINEQYQDDFNPFWHSAADSLGHFNLPFYEKCAKLAFATLADRALGDSLFLSMVQINPMRDDIIIYPNPGTDQITIEYDAANASNYTIEISSLNGQVLLTVPTISTSSSRVNVADLSKGIYLIRIIQENATSYYGKWVKL